MGTISATTWRGRRAYVRVVSFRFEIFFSIKLHTPIWANAIIEKNNKMEDLVLQNETKKARVNPSQKHVALDIFFTFLFQHLFLFLYTNLSILLKTA